MRRNRGSRRDGGQGPRRDSIKPGHNPLSPEAQRFPSGVIRFLIFPHAGCREATRLAIQGGPTVDAYAVDRNISFTTKSFVGTFTRRFGEHSAEYNIRFQNQCFIGLVWDLHCRDYRDLHSENVMALLSWNFNTDCRGASAGGSLKEMKNERFQSSSLNGRSVGALVYRPCPCDSGD